MNKFFLFALALGLVAVVRAQVVEPAEPERPDKLEAIMNLIGDVTALPEWFQQLLNKKFENRKNRPDEEDDQRKRGPPHRGGPRMSGRKGGPKRRGGLLHLNEADMEDIEIPDWFTAFLEQMTDGARAEVTFADDVPEWFQIWFTAFHTGLQALKQEHQERRQEKRADIVKALVGDVTAFPDWFQQIIAKKIEETQEDHDEPKRGGPPHRWNGRTRGPPPPQKGGKFFKLDDDDLEGIEVPEWFTEFRKQMKSRDRRPWKQSREITFADDVPEWFQTWFTGYHTRMQELREKRTEGKPQHIHSSRSFPARRDRKPAFWRHRYGGP